MVFRKPGPGTTQKACGRPVASAAPPFAARFRAVSVECAASEGVTYHAPVQLRSAKTRAGLPHAVPAPVGVTDLAWAGTVVIPLSRSAPDTSK